MDKALQLLSIARKGGRIEVGEEPVSAIARAGKARLIVLASDAAPHTQRRVARYADTQPNLRIPFDKEALGQAVGRTACAIAAITDAALALAFVRALDAPPPELEAFLSDKAQRLRKRQLEAQAHTRNVRSGKKKP